MKYFFALVLLLSVAFAAEEIKTPEKLYKETIDQLGSQAWLTYQQKLQQLLETYAYNTDHEGSSIEYKTSDDEKCRNGKTGVVYRMGISRLVQGNISSTTINHWACGRHMLQEHIAVTGDGNYKLSSFDIFNGKRVFQTPEGQQSVEYTVSSAFDEIYFRTFEEDLGTGRNFMFYLGNQLLSEFNFDKSEEQVLFETYGLDISWKFSDSGRWRVYNPETRSGIIAYADSLGTRFLGANSGQDRSLSTFKSFMNYMVLNMIRVGISDQFKKIDEVYLPQSQFSSAGGGNDKFVEELRRLIVLLQQGNDNQTVITELLKYIEAAEKNQLRDLRQ